MKTYDVLGWAWALACSSLDKGEDPRKVEMPEVMAAFERDFPKVANKKDERPKSRTDPYPMCPHCGAASDRKCSGTVIEYCFKCERYYTVRCIRMPEGNPIYVTQTEIIVYLQGASNA